MGKQTRVKTLSYSNSAIQCDFKLILNILAKFEEYCGLTFFKLCRATSVKNIGTLAFELERLGFYKIAYDSSPTHFTVFHKLDLARSALFNI